MDKSIKDGQGIFLFTPPKSIRKVVNYIDHILRHKYKTVLEPCGSCEFIKYIDKKDDLTITAIEYNETIYDKIIQLKFKTMSYF